MSVSTDPTIEISHRGDIRPRTVDAAVDKISQLTSHHGDPVSHIEIRLVLESDPARERPALAEATFVSKGTPVRAHMAGSTVEEAVDLLTDRLRRRLNRVEERRRHVAERHRTDSSSWRHGDLPMDRPEYRELPFDEREVSRHKTFAMTPMSIDEAAFDLDQLGHDFYLFVDLESGNDCVVQHNSDGGVEVAGAGAEIETFNGVVASAVVPPTLTLAEAKEHLEATGDRHVFYLSGDPARGHVLYRRYDGHYGLVTAV